MNKCLIVSYHFAPGAQVGAIRPTKFARYLPGHGWEAHVLTVAEKYHALKTDWQREDLPRDDHLHRTRMWVHPNEIYLGLKRLFVRGAREGADRPAPAAPTGPQVWIPRHTPIRNFVNSLLLLPDDKLPWLPVGLSRALSLVRRHRMDAVLTTGPPHSTHLIGLALKRLLGVAWLADLRDPWVSNVTKSLNPRTRLSVAMDRRMERAVIHRADRVIVTNDFVREEFLNTYPTLPPDRIVVIPNGFDKLDFTETGVGECPKEFTLVHTGNLYNRRSPRTFLQALSQLIQSGRIPASRLRAQFVGRMVGEARPERAIRELGLEEIVCVSDPVPHLEAIAIARRADLLLIFAQGEPNQIPAKAFEYIATGNPILVIPEGGAAAEFVRARHLGWAAADQPEPIAEAIAECYGRFEHEGRDVECESPWLDPSVRRFDREALAGNLAELLDEAIATSNGRNPG
ncbi:MAG: hypothetical protein CMJ84_07545 [Planctomycetes bacterium]|jgi:glycosyltransferase involved in cell wall biosynthesis|nr:hypothetical protein [Planctomycetota bacterium]MDP6410393.1 glycosyltransferase [Planctomycetota bacterium]